MGLFIRGYRGLVFSVVRQSFQTLMGALGCFNPGRNDGENFRVWRSAARYHYPLPHLGCPRQFVPINSDISSPELIAGADGIESALRLCSAAE